MNRLINNEKPIYHLYGYIDDGSLYGFKTPVFTDDPVVTDDSRNLFIQDARGESYNERITEFIKIDPKEERTITRLGGDASHPEYQAQVGLRPLFIFSNGLSKLYIGQKRSMFHYLYRWSYQDENNNPFVYLDVLCFIHAPEKRIIKAIEACAAQLKSEGANYHEGWAEHQISTLKSYSSLNPEYDDKAPINISTNKKDLRASIESKFTDLEKHEQRTFTTYCLAKELIDGKEPETFARGVRELFAALASSDHKLTHLSELRLLVRLEYAEAIWKQLHVKNQRRILPESREPKLDRRSLEAFLVSESDSLMVSLFRLLGTYFAADLSNEQLHARSVIFAKADDWEKGLLTVGRCQLSIDDRLKPVIFYRDALPDDQCLMVNMRNNRQCTARGEEYVRSVLNLFLPGLLPKERAGSSVEHTLKDLYMGASNSWVTLICKGIDIGRVTAGGGRLLQQLSYAIGIRRFTLVEKRVCSTQSEWLSLIGDFVSVAWSDCYVENCGDFSVRLVVDNVDPDQGNVAFRTPFTRNAIKPLDYRKVITFISMFEKIFVPRFRYVLVSRIEGQEYDLKKHVQDVYQKNKKVGADVGFSTDWAPVPKTSRFE